MSTGCMCFGRVASSCRNAGHNGETSHPLKADAWSMHLSIRFDVTGRKGLKEKASGTVRDRAGSVCSCSKPTCGSALEALRKQCPTLYAAQKRNPTPCSIVTKITDKMHDVATFPCVSDSLTKPFACNPKYHPPRMPDLALAPSCSALRAVRLHVRLCKGRTLMTVGKCLICADAA